MNSKNDIIEIAQKEMSKEQLESFERQIFECGFAYSSSSTNGMIEKVYPDGTRELGVWTAGAFVSEKDV